MLKATEALTTADVQMIRKVNRYDFLVVMIMNIGEDFFHAFRLTHIVRAINQVAFIFFYISKRRKPKPVK
jgi:hypothetical protein